MNNRPAPSYPIFISTSLAAAEQTCAGHDPAACHAIVLSLADAITYYLGAVAVARYSQAYVAGEIDGDPTLNRSLRSLRRVLPGQWLGWTARALTALKVANSTDDGRRTTDDSHESSIDERGTLRATNSRPSSTLTEIAEWFTQTQHGDLARAYSALRGIMVERLGYTGEYGPRDSVSPRLLLELIDQYRIRRGKSPAAPQNEIDVEVVTALLPGLRALLESASFLTEYQLYAPAQRQLLMAPKPTAPMPPIPSLADAAATILLYPPGEAPDYTKRPDLQTERQPLFPLDPLLIYLNCPHCNRPRVAALQSVEAGTPSYFGLDPECGHTLSAEC
jgi:hypothetical protein